MNGMSGFETKGWHCLAVVVLLATAGFACGAAEIDARSFGAKGDGKRDDTAALQKALDKASSQSVATVRLPAGLYRIGGSLRVPSGVTLEGAWTAPHHADAGLGSALLGVGGKGSAEGPALLEMEPSSCVRGLTICYPEQDSEAVAPYPFSIRGRGMHVTVTDVTLVNSYQGIDMGTHWNELHLIRNVFGCCLSRGVVIDRCSDIGRIENVHFNPHYWFRARMPKGSPKVNTDAVIRYMNGNLDAFVFGRTDWEYVTNTFAYAFRNCYHFIQTRDGAANGQFLGIGADAGQCCVRVEAVQPMGLLITNGEFVALAGENPVQVATAPSFAGAVQFSNCAFWGDSSALARLEGPGHTSFSQCVFINCGRGGDAAMVAANGTLQVSNCMFNTAKTRYFEFGDKLKAAIVSGNVFHAPQNLASDPARGIVVSGNVEVEAR